MASRKPVNRSGASLFRYLWVVILAAAGYAAMSIAIEPYLREAIPQIAEQWVEGMRESPHLQDYAAPAIFDEPIEAMPEMDRWDVWGWRGASALLLCSGLGAIACGITGGIIRRWLLLLMFLLMVFAINTAIEARMFVGMTGEAYMVLGIFVPGVFATLVLALGLWPATGLPNGLRGASTGGTVTMRLFFAWLGFIVVYHVIGGVLMNVRPDFQEFYAASEHLRIPRPEVVLGTQAVRSLIYLIPTVAVIERWGAGRFSLLLAVFWAHWTLVGLGPLVLPNNILDDPNGIGYDLRIGHALEIGADSLLYAIIVVALLAMPKRLSGVIGDNGIPLEPSAGTRPL